MSNAQQQLPTLSDVAHEACELAGLIEGLDVLFDQVDGGETMLTAKRARNAFRPYLEMLIKQSADLSNRLDLLSDHGILTDLRRSAD